MTIKEIATVFAGKMDLRERSTEGRPMKGRRRGPGSNHRPPGPARNRRRAVGLCRWTPGRSGSRSLCPPSSARIPSRLSKKRPMRVVFSARGAPSRTPFYCGGSCAVATAGSSSRPTEPTATTAWPAITCARTTTRCVPVGRTAVAPNGVSAPTSSTTSSSTRYANCSLAPELLSAGEAALAAQAPVPDDELLAA